MAEPIEIIIRQGGQNGAGFGGGNNGNAPSGGARSTGRNAPWNLSGADEKTDVLLKNLTIGEMMIIDYAKKNAKQLINFGIAQYGNLTGDYIGQRNIRNVMSVASSLTNIAMGAVMGFKMGGPYGAVVGAGIALAGEVANVGMQYQTYQTDIKKQNLRADIMRERAGSTLGSGSRGTYE